MYYRYIASYTIKWHFSYTRTIMEWTSRANTLFTRIPWHSQFHPLLLNLYHHEGIDRDALHRADFKAVGVYAGLHLAGSVFSRLQNRLKIPNWTKG